MADIKWCHINHGHPQPQEFLRALRVGGESEDRVR